jgi:hypothetical protein
MVAENQALWRGRNIYDKLQIASLGFPLVDPGGIRYALPQIERIVEGSLIPTLYACEIQQVVDSE